MKEKSVVEKQEETVVVMPESNTPNLDKITGKFLVTPCKKSWLQEVNPDYKDFALFDKAEIWLPAPRRSDITDAVNTRISKEEQAEFEREMNLMPGTMSPFNLVFWQRHQNVLKVPVKGITLDCDNNIKHKMFYRLLQANGSKVAMSKEELSINSAAEILVTNTENEAKIDNAKLNLKTKAFAKFASMSLSDKINFLKVYKEGSFKVNENTNSDLIDQAIGTVVDKNPNEFLSTLDNTYYKDYIFIQDLIEKNIIIRKQGIYQVNGGEPLGSTITDIVLALTKNQELKIALKAKQENTK